MIAMLTLPNFNMLATTGFLDPFRAANYLNRGYLYDWQFVSPMAGAVVASNGMVIAGTEAISQHEKPADIVVISASWTPEEFASPAILAWLRRQERRGAMLGGIDTGAFILGYGGLLNNHAASVHFEHHASFREIFPAETLSPLPFSIDACSSAAGGTAQLILVSVFWPCWKHLNRRVKQQPISIIRPMTGGWRGIQPMQPDQPENVPSCNICRRNFRK